MDLTKSEIENKLIAAMKSAMTIDSDSDDESDYEDEDYEDDVQLQVRIHEFDTSPPFCIKIVLEDYLVESVVYYGSDQLGDQNQHALTPFKETLQLTSTELFENTWIEFCIQDGTESVNMWLRTEYICMNDQSSPMNIELVDREYKYIVRSSVLSENEICYFKNLEIQTVE